MQIPYLPVRGRKLPRVMGGNIGSREEICETSSLPIPMVLRLHQCNGYIKRKLRAWRVQKCIALDDADTVLELGGKPVRACRLPGCRIGPTMEICVNFGLPIAMVPCLHQSNFYIKWKLWQGCSGWFSEVVGDDPLG